MIIYLIFLWSLQICYSYDLSNQAIQDGISESVRVLHGDPHCSLPEFPRYGRYAVLGSEISIPPIIGTLVLNATVLYYSCDTGYEPIITPTAICHNGRWITGFQQCRSSRSCILPNIPAFGTYKIHGGFGPPTPGQEAADWTVLIFSCKPLHNLVGENFTLCREGEWSSETPHCRRSQKCIMPIPPKYGNYVIVGSNVATPTAGSIVEGGTALYFICKGNTIFSGGTVNVCHEGNWLGGVPKCEDTKDCIIPKSPDFGYYAMVGSSIPPVPGSFARERDTLLFSCHSKYQLIGKEFSTCIEGKWSNDKSFCEESRGCMLPTYPLNGGYVIISSMSTPNEEGQEVPESTILEFSCNNLYNLFGRKLTYCKNKNWVHDFPECRVIDECSSIEGERSGVYFIKPSVFHSAYAAYCDLSLNGEKWTVISSRFNGSVDFYKDYHDYTFGFGSPKGEHWLGLETIHQLTRDNSSELYVQLEFFNGTQSFARYNRFSIDSQYTGFKLYASNYSGNAGNALDRLNGMRFSTPDHEQDLVMHSCAEKVKGAWWFKGCYHGNINSFSYSSDVGSRGMMWMSDSSPLKSARMLVRRTPSKKKTQINTSEVPDFKL